MMDSIEYIRKHIRDMPAYEPIYPLEVLSHELGIPVMDLVKLDANENPFGTLPEVRKILAISDSLHIYPDPESRILRKTLADHHRVFEGNLIIGAGADELIDLIMRVVLEPGDSLINCPPTFGMYAFDASLNQARVLPVPRKADFSLDLGKIKQVVEEQKPRLLFIAHPNNPDGSVITESQFGELVELPLLVVIDEAYIQFVDQGRSYLNEVVSRNNLIVLRTFSKWAGLAGLRIGYGVFPQSLVPFLMRAKQPYNVSVAAQQAAVVTMSNLSEVEKNIKKLIQLREQLQTALAQIMWLKTYPSQANFILCRVEGRSALSVMQHLREQGILVRYFNKPGLSDHIRISIGTPKQNGKLLTALKGIG